MDWKIRREKDCYLKRWMIENSDIKFCQQVQVSVTNTVYDISCIWNFCSFSDQEPQPSQVSKRGTDPHETPWPQGLISPCGHVDWCRSISLGSHLLFLGNERVKFRHVNIIFTTLYYIIHVHIAKSSQRYIWLQIIFAMTNVYPFS